MKTLKLDRDYKPIEFITMKKTAKLISKDKVEVLAEWPNITFYKNSKLPAIVVLKEYVRKKILPHRFTLKGIFRRDLYICQYTGVALLPDQLTVDHIIPKSRGGKSTWENCVTASRKINLEKGNKTPEEAGLKLLNKPTSPYDKLTLEYITMGETHPSWSIYFPGITNQSRKM
jgi:5-methylcytosine-specific restriction endonuclease McrA